MNGSKIDDAKEAPTPENASLQEPSPNAVQSKGAPTAKNRRRFGIRVVNLRSCKSTNAITESAPANQWSLGHGHLFVSGEMALDAILKLKAEIDWLQDQDPPCEPRVLLQRMRILKDLNRQLLESGKAHLKAYTQRVEMVTPR